MGEDTKAAWERLCTRLTPERRHRLERAAAHRTSHIRLVIQDIHHAHNISACLRSAEAFGILNVDVVCTTESFKISSVAKGTADWLRITKFKSVTECAHNLQALGYKIAAGVPRPDVTPLGAVPLEDPIAIVFGNEHAGLSREWEDFLDLVFTIPMVGLVESLNISVSAALSLYSLTCAARERVRADRFYLRPDEQLRLLIEWVDRS